MYKGAKVLVTGGNGGLGKNLCLNYAKHGAKIINISRDKKKLVEINNQLNSINNLNNLYYSSDISNYENVNNICKELVKNNNFPNIIINNAAGNFLCPFEKLSKNGWSRIIDIVLNGSFNMYHIFGKEVINQTSKNNKNNKNNKTVFLNISTTYSENSSALVIPSAVAKAGVDNLMKGLTVEWSKYGMRFVGIAPGPISESGGASKLDPIGIFKKYNNYVNPSQRMCNPEEISNLAMFLTSKDADYINGEIIRIDGGEWVKNQGEFSFLTNIPYYEKILIK